MSASGLWHRWSPADWIASWRCWWLSSHPVVVALSSVMVFSERWHLICVPREDGRGCWGCWSPCSSRLGFVFGGVGFVVLGASVTLVGVGPVIVVGSWRVLVIDVVAAVEGEDADAFWSRQSESHPPKRQISRTSLDQLQRFHCNGWTKARPFWEKAKTGKVDLKKAGRGIIFFVGGFTWLF